MEKEFIRGLIIENTKENGGLIKCMEREHLYGQTDVNTQASIQKTKRKAMGNLLGRMEGATEENGLMENNMEKALMLQVQARKNMENGKRERE